MTLTEMLDRPVRCFPEKEAIVAGTLRYSYREVGERVNRLTNALLSLGIKRGDRVALLAKNSADYLIVYFGVFQGRAVACPVNFRLAPGEMEYLINQSDARYFFFEAEFLERVLTIKPRLTKVEYFILLGQEEVQGLCNSDQLMAQASAQKPSLEVDETDVAIQMYTSGTTGVPKGAMLTHRNCAAASFMGALVMNINSQGRSLVSAPLFHIAATTISFITVLVGGTIVILSQFEPLQVLDTIQREKITHTFFVPSMAQMLLQVPEIGRYDVTSLQSLHFGGAPLTYDLLEKSHRLFHCHILASFGQTECAAIGINMSPEIHRQIVQDPNGLGRLLSAAGKEIPGLQARIVDEKDEDVPVGEVGEIIFCGDHIMIGYYKMPQETEEALRGGWLHTGDLGKFDKDRYLYVVDRKKDMIISGGENIYSQEIERVLHQIPAVAEAAVVGMPHEKWGEVPKAFVVRTPSAQLTEQEVLAFCRKNLAGYKCPKEVVFMEILPKNAAGKILKRELREIGLT